jgi:hypothetical protein
MSDIETEVLVRAREIFEARPSHHTSQRHAPGAYGETPQEVTPEWALGMAVTEVDGDLDLHERVFRDAYRRLMNALPTDPPHRVCPINTYCAAHTTDEMLRVFDVAISKI